MCLSGESAFQEMNPCPKEQQDCGKQKRKADGQQEEVFMQIALRIQIFGESAFAIRQKMPQSRTAVPI